MADKSSNFAKADSLPFIYHYVQRKRKKRKGGSIFNPDGTIRCSMVVPCSEVWTC